MEIKSSAHKHGISDTDIAHAVNNPLRIFALDDLEMIIGSAHNGQLLEIGIVRSTTVVHAMPARDKFLRRLHK